MKKPQSIDRFVAKYGLDLTPGQRAWALPMYDGVHPKGLPPGERETAIQLYGLDELPDGVEDLPKVSYKGARAGGTRIGAGACYRAALVTAVDLAPNEAASVIFVGPDVRLGRLPLTYALGMAQQDAREGKIEIERESADGFTVVRHDGVRIAFEALPATRGGSAVRGRVVVAAMMTETSYFRDADAVINDEDIWSALAPRVVKGGLLLSESTAWSSVGLHYELMRANHGNPTTALAAVVPTLAVRPEMRAVVERERQRDAARAEMEFDAVPLQIGGERFFSDCVDHCVDAAIPEVIHSVPSEAVVGAGWDLALNVNSSAECIGARVGKHWAPIEMHEIRPPRDRPLALSHVVQTFGAHLKRRGVRTVLADRHLIEAAREWASPLGIRIQAIKNGPDAKNESYIALRQAMREGRVRLPNNPRLIAQLKSVTAKPLSGGGLKIDSPQRGRAHGDLVSALVLAFAAVSSPSNRMAEALRIWEQRGGAHGAALRAVEAGTLDGFAWIRGEMNSFDDWAYRMRNQRR